jgi:hypothetical protein
MKPAVRQRWQDSSEHRDGTNHVPTVLEMKPSMIPWKALICPSSDTPASMKHAMSLQRRRRETLM